VVCASATECQSVQLNFSRHFSSENGSEEVSGSAELVESSVGRLTSRDCQYHVGQNADTTDGTAGGRVVGCTCTVPLSVDDGCSKSQRLRREFARTDLSLSSTTNECDELFVGPVKGSQAPCPVSVEFEGIIFKRLTLR